MSLFFAALEKRERMLVTLSLVSRSCFAAKRRNKAG